MSEPAKKPLVAVPAAEEAEPAPQHPDDRWQQIGTVANRVLEKLAERMKK